MGKKRIAQLLEQLQDNQQQDLQNAAAIFTVAQVAVNQLQAQIDASPDPQAPTLPAQPAANLPALPPAPLDQAELKRRYGSHNACRGAAKKLGIKFSKNPSWEQMVAAFNYHEACQQIVRAYLQEHPSNLLRGVAIEIKLG